jgi:hypothetical protein
MTSAEETVIIARRIMEHARDAAGNDPAEARAKTAEMLANIIGFIAVDAFDEPDGRGLLSDIVTHMSGAKSSRDG